MNEKKRKCGAEKRRDKNKLLLKSDATKCAKLMDFFANSASTHSTTKNDHQLVIKMDRESTAMDRESTAMDSESITMDNEKLPTDMPTESDSAETTQANMMENSDVPRFKMFKRPKMQEIEFFFQNHPIQPRNDAKLPFISKKVFYRENGSNRRWLSYDESSSSLYCTVCLAFAKSSEKNTFTEGMNNWKHIHQRISEHENSKMHNTTTECFFMAKKQRNIGCLLFAKNTNLKREQVKKKRQVLERVIQVVKVMGKRGMSFRGKVFEAAYTLQDPTLDHGNFLELILLLSKYDVTLKEHLDSVIRKSQKSHDQGNKTRGGLVTFLSKTTVNLIVQTISSLIKKSICDEIMEASMYSIQIDTTQDISVRDQCSIIVRYVKNGNIYERLIGLVKATDSTGKGLFDLLQGVLHSNNLKVENCVANATDGAANMQGQYNGFSAWLAKASPNHTHVWCYSHILNLVLSDATKSSISAASLFNLLNSVAVFFKESYQRMDIWTETTANKNRKLQTIGETRWWAKEVALNKIFGSFHVSENAFYVDAILALHKIVKCDKTDPGIRVKAQNLKDGLLKYDTILTSHIYLRIFQITSPLSKYLQSSGVDLLKCHQLVMAAQKQLETIQRDMDSVVKAASDFIEWAADEIEERCPDSDIIIQENFPEKRMRRVKKMPGETLADSVNTDALKKYTFDVHNKILDTVVESMRERFVKNGKLYMDLSLLSPINFDEVKKGLPPYAFQNLSEKLIKYNSQATTENLQHELVHFARNWEYLQKSIEEEQQMFVRYEILEQDGESQHEETPCKRCKNCCICCYNVLVKYNLFSTAYSVLGTAYKYLLTLPITQVACERSFSTLKFVKTRLRSTLTDAHLEALLLMAIEKDILHNIDCDSVIDEVAKTSTLLRNELLF